MSPLKKQRQEVTLDIQSVCWWWSQSCSLWLYL